jgi:hypothetical protein
VALLLIQLGAKTCELLSLLADAVTLASQPLAGALLICSKGSVSHDRYSHVMGEDWRNTVGWELTVKAFALLLLEAFDVLVLRHSW